MVLLECRVLPHVTRSSLMSRPIGTTYFTLLILHTKGHSRPGTAEPQAGTELPMTHHVRSACFTYLSILLIAFFMLLSTCLIVILLKVLFKELSSFRRTSGCLLLGQKSLCFNRETAVREQDLFNITTGFDFITRFIFNRLEHSKVPLDQLLLLALS